MKKFQLMKIVGIIALIAIIGIAMVGCDLFGNEDRPVGTYYYKGIKGSQSLSITFSGSNFTMTSTLPPPLDFNIPGTFTVSGKTITLNPAIFNPWTIVNSTTIRDKDGDEWRK